MKMDGAKHNTDTLEALWKECSGKQAYNLCRSFSERKDGTNCNANPGNSRK